MKVIVDTGGANLASVQNGLYRLGCEAQVTQDHQTIRSASHVILPGVGAAADAMDRLRSADLIGLLKSLTQPVIGFCLGMQILFESSEEGNVDCLGIIPGKIKKIPVAPGITVPHMGWNQIKRVQKDDRLLTDEVDEKFFYFVHSFAAPVNEFTSSTSQHGITFAASVQRQNFFGTQFHPEKSGPVGAKILEAFLNL